MAKLARMVRQQLSRDVLYVFHLEYIIEAVISVLSVFSHCFQTLRGYFPGKFLVKLSLISWFHLFTYAVFPIY